MRRVALFAVALVAILAIARPGTAQQTEDVPRLPPVVVTPSRIEQRVSETPASVTVISGDMMLGMGDKLDPAKGAQLAPGGFVKAEANMNHYVVSQGGGVVQISAEGPFAITYVDPKDDPRKP